ncbi:hypothetical protein [Parapedobacter sp. DT-150]|uniref:hypothetical protein n=1 Tax=Parapedobacter sp. DT-150 TaxID=3396162 RepID=UPI003F1AD74E
MSVIKKKRDSKKQEQETTRFERYDKAPYFIEKNKQAAKLIKETPIPDWMRK